MSAILSDICYVKPGCTPGYFRSVWDRLCEQLFGSIPIGMDASSQLPNIEIWKDGVVPDSTNPQKFTVVTDNTEAPKASDVILYKGKYYIIGAVETEE